MMYIMAIFPPPCLSVFAYSRKQHLSHHFKIFKPQVSQFFPGGSIATKVNRNHESPAVVSGISY